MAWPTPSFATLTNPQPLSVFDNMFAAVAGIVSIPSTATGTNAISLTPVVNAPAIAAYSELCGFRFRAVGTSSGLVTAQANGLGFLPVYHADGVTQANVGDLVTGEQYIVTYSLSLNGGLGGFFLESPSFGAASASGGTPVAPQGRLTLQSAVPVMFTNQLAQQTIYYAPYKGNGVPLYNGSTMAMYQFTSSLSDQVGLSLALAGSTNWPTNTNFDVFVTLNPGPVLGTVAWTNNTTRANTLNNFGGFLTNAGAITLRISAAATIPVAANQATFLGTFQTSAAGQTQWQFGGAASGGTAAFFNIANYYNPVLFVTSVTDNGTAYSYNSATVREARASAGNQINFVQPTSERAISAVLNSNGTMPNGGGTSANTGIGVNVTNAFASSQLASYFLSTGSQAFTLNQAYNFSFTGFGFFASLEQVPGASGNVTFGTPNVLQGALWL